MKKETKQEKTKSDFVVKISDGFCEYEYGFSGSQFSINDYVKSIEMGLKIKKNYEKRIKSSLRDKQ